MQYQAVIQMAQMAPDIYDLPQLHRQMLEVLGIKDADKLVPLPDDQKPKDPVAENMAALKGEPLKAFFYQDHEAHIKVHTMAMQDPIIMQLIGQNPKAPVIQAAMQAHIAEHVGFGYRQKIEQQLGMPLPPADEKLPPQIEVALSGMMAQAAQQLLQQNQQQAAQQQAQQQQQDPVLQMQKQELQIRQQEVQIKQQEAQAKAQQAQADLQLRQQELQQRMAMENKKIQTNALAQAGKFKMDNKKLQVEALAKAGDFKFRKQETGIDIAKTASQQRHDKDMQTNQPRKETPKE